MDNTPFGEIVKQRRKALNWNQAKLAQQAGISQASISRIERGEQVNNFQATRNRIEKALKIGKVTARSDIDNKILEEMRKLGRRDKITVLRYLIRLNNPPEKTEKILKPYLTEE
jgi:transcriptional regulator with XRE-family HTH domain